MKLLTITIDKSRVFGLDLLRAIAILLVVIGHSVYLLPDNIREQYQRIPLPDGVSIFFVLSGFLIGRIFIQIIEKQDISIGVVFNFWKRRWLRTLPAYYLVLVILIVLSYLFVENFQFSTALPYFIFSQNIFTVHPPFFIEAWSLSIEEWFYLIMPVIIYLLISIFSISRRKSLLLCICSIIIGTILIRYYRYLTIPINSAESWGAIFRGQVITRLDSLMFGVTGAYCSIYYQFQWKKYQTRGLIAGLISVVLVAILPMIFFPDSVFYYCNISFLVSSISILLLLPFLSQFNFSKGAFYKIITYTSLVSYSMYLTHSALILVFVVNKITFLQSGTLTTILGRYLLFWLLTYLVAILMYKYWELPFISLRDSRTTKSMKLVKQLNQSPETIIR